MSAAAEPARGRTGFVVGRADEIPDGGRVIVEVGGRSVGVFNVGGRFHAVLNTCPHQGAPLCHGPLVPEIRSDQPGDIRFAGGRTFLQCPWHRWEFDLETGQSWFDPRTRARPFRVAVVPGAELGPDTPADPVLHERTVPGTVHGTVLPQDRFPGPYTAEMVDVVVEYDYVVLYLGR